MWPKSKVCDDGWAGYAGTLLICMGMSVRLIFPHSFFGVRAADNVSGRASESAALLPRHSKGLKAASMEEGLGSVRAESMWRFLGCH